MAVTVAQITLLSKNRARLLIAGDGAGSFTLTNAMLTAAFSAVGPPLVSTPGFLAGTPLGDLVRTPVANNAAAVNAMMGEATPNPQANGRIFFVTQTTGALQAPAAVVPTAAAGLITLVLTVPAAAGSWEFVIEQAHSLVR